MIQISLKHSSDNSISKAKWVRDEVLTYGNIPLLSIFEFFKKTKKKKKSSQQQPPEEAALSHKRSAWSCWNRNLPKPTPPLRNGAEPGFSPASPELLLERDISCHAPANRKGFKKMPTKHNKNKQKKKKKTPHMQTEESLIQSLHPYAKNISFPSQVLYGILT